MRRRGHHGRALMPVTRRITISTNATPLKRRPIDHSRTFVAGSCVICGTAFIQKHDPRHKAHCCSAECSRKASRHRRRDRERTSAKTKPVYRRKVYERDGWRCRLCGKRLNRKAKVPHPSAPTIDHILPIALGGTHTYENIFAAHFRCNSAKGPRVEQLQWGI